MATPKNSIVTINEIGVTYIFVSITVIPSIFTTIGINEPNIINKDCLDNIDDCFTEALSNIIISTANNP